MDSFKIVLIILAIFLVYCYLKNNGYFKEDPLNLSRIGGSLGDKNQDIIKSLDKLLNLPNNYKYAYVDQMTLRDFLVYDNDEIIKNCNNAFNELKRLKSKTISKM